MIQASKILKIENNLEKKKQKTNLQIKLIIKKENRAASSDLKRNPRQHYFCQVVEYLTRYGKSKTGSQLNHCQLYLNWH